MDSGRASSAEVDVLLEQVFELAALLGEGMEDELGAQGLTRARAELLWRLHDAGPMTQRQLSEALQCTPRNVTGLVDALEAADLARRSPHPTDRRATLVSLTDDGEATVARWRDGYAGLARSMFDGASASDLRAVRRTLGRALDHLRARGAE